MKNITRLLLFIPFLLVLFYACQHDPIQVDQGTPPDDDTIPEIVVCDPDTVYFVNDLLPLLVSSCARSGCHDAASQQDGVIITDYQSIMQTADVTPGNPGESDLYKVLVEDDLDDRMPPPPNEPLTAGQIQMAYNWIIQGAQNLECTETACNLDNVTYSETVAANLLNYGCVGCHTGSSASGGVLLSNYTEVVGVANSGRLMGAINRLAGYAAMPPSGEPMAQCPTDQIQKWIDDGTPNN